jgi:hypothetical protein
MYQGDERNLIYSRHLLLRQGWIMGFPLARRKTGRMMQINEHRRLLSAWQIEKSAILFSA